MSFIYGLALVLIIFEGIIIQCEGAGGGTSWKRRQGAPTKNINEKLPSLPFELIEDIMSRTDYRTLHMAIEDGLDASVMGRKLQNCIILIEAEDFDYSYSDRDSDSDSEIEVILSEGMHEEFCNGNTYLFCKRYEDLISFFEQYGDKVKKIEFRNRAEYEDIPKFHNFLNHIKSCAQNLDELRTVIDDGEEFFWDNILDEKNGIHFPEVKKFLLHGDIDRKEFNLHSIFPKLESLVLNGDIADENFLADVKELKEFSLEKSFIFWELKDKLEEIFANNTDMRKIYLYEPDRTEIMRSIAKHLTKLETLKVYDAGEDFLFRENHEPPNVLLSLIHFDIFYDSQISIENLSFEMPHLKRLTFKGYSIDDRIVHFIELFEELEAVELDPLGFNAVKCIGKLPNIKEFTINIHKDDFASLREMFESLDETSKLQTLKIVFDDLYIYRNYEKKLRSINFKLINSKELAWIISHGDRSDIETGQKYLMFRREPCTGMSCKK